MCRNWTSPICSVCNITPGIPSTSIKCIQIFPSRWVKVKLGIVYCWSIQVQGPPNSSPEPRVVRLTNVRFIPSQVIYSWRSFESQAALLKTRSSNSKCGTNLFYSGLIGLKSFEHLMGEFFLFSNPNFYLISYENKRVHQKNTTAQPYHHRRTGFYDFDALWTSHPDNRPRQWNQITEIFLL